jgi:hypothetical protein
MSKTWWWHRARRERDILGRLPTPLGVLNNDVPLCGEP